MSDEERNAYIGLWAEATISTLNFSTKDAADIMLIKDFKSLMNLREKKNHEIDNDLLFRLYYFGMTAASGKIGSGWILQIQMAQRLVFACEREILERFRISPN